MSTPAPMRHPFINIAAASPDSLSALALAINPANTTTGEVAVADVEEPASRSRGYNYTGGSLWTYGQAGGYEYNSSGGVAPSPNVSNNKLYLDTSAGFGGTIITTGYTDYTFLAFQPDGNSLWVGDGGNSRSLHLTDTGTSVNYS